MKHFGMNYGILFSAWGVGAFVMVRVAEMVKVQTGNFNNNFAVATVLLLVGAVMAFTLRPHEARAKAAAPALDLVEEENLVLQETK